MSKLLLIGPGSIHTYNYHKLIEGYFEDVLLVTDKIRPEYTDINTIPGDFSIRNLVKGFENFRFLKKQIELYKPDLIHVHQADSTSFLTLKASQSFNIPVVVTVWGSDVLVLPGQGILKNKMVNFNLRRADYITADSHFVAKRIKEITPEIKNEILVANFGIEPFFEEGKKENLIYSNRLHEPLYRIDDIIRGFSKFMKEGNMDWRLVLAGEGSETESLKLLVKKTGLNDKIQFVGWLDKSANYEYYNRAKIFVSIPESDATAISLLEALSANCIPIVSDLPANREWIEHGRNGIIVVDRKDNYIQQAIDLNYDNLININAELTKNKATKLVNRKYFLELYNEILGR